MTRHAEILEQKITGEDVRRGEILDALAVVQNRRFGAQGVSLLDIQIQRSDATLRVHVVEDDVTLFGAHDARRDVEELGEQCVGETLATKGEALKELCVGEPADAVAKKDATILIHHMLPRRSL